MQPAYICMTIKWFVLFRSYDALLQEKRELEEDFERLQQEAKPMKEGNQTKELAILKKVIKNLEVCVTTNVMSYGTVVIQASWIIE